MASVTKSTSGSVTTYTITDQAGTTGTIAVTVGAVTGNTVTVSTTAMLNDGIGMMTELFQQIRTGLLPGSGAQRLIP